METAIVVREARLGDVPVLTRIYRPIVETTSISFEEIAPDEEEMERRFTAVTQTYPWLVAVDAGEVVGYAYASQHRARACYRWSVDVSVYVDAERRRRGAGRELYGELLAELERRKYHRAFAGIALPNDASVALHRTCGFEPVGVYQEVGKKFGRWLDVSWWQRPLAE